MKYLLTYKFSQDHIELFFGAVRSTGGFNNNPTAYKRLLMRGIESLFFINNISYVFGKIS